MTIRKEELLKNTFIFKLKTHPKLPKGEVNAPSGDSGLLQCLSLFLCFCPRIA